MFGGGAVLVGADDGQDPREPLNEGAIRSVDFLDAVDARELRPNTWETDRRKPLFGEPLTYRLQRSGGGGANESAVWHRSRLVIFDGAPTTRRRRQLLHGWGESELQRLYSILAHFNGGWEATGSLLQQASQGVLKIKDLMAMMAADKRDVLKRRFEMMDLALGVTGSMLIGEDEDYSRTEVGALTGVADLLTKNLLLLSGAAEIPVTVLMGQSPAGLSATGESDVRWFYDRTKSAQTNVLLPRHRRLARLVCLAKNGPMSGLVPPRLTITYPPLWQPTPMEQADLRQKQSATDAAYINAQVLTAEEVAVSRFRIDGWNPETTIDLVAREDATRADREAARETRAQGGDEGRGTEGEADEPAIGGFDESGPRADAKDKLGREYNPADHPKDEGEGHTGKFVSTGGGRGSSKEGGGSGGAHKLDPESLSALSKAAPGVPLGAIFKAPEPAEQEVIRDKSRAVLKDVGIKTGPREGQTLENPNMKKLVLSETGPAGTMRNDGHLVMRKDHYAAMCRFVQHAQQDTVEKATYGEIDGMGTLLHETFHAHSPMPPKEITGLKHDLNEAMAETAARTALDRSFGATGPAVNLPNKDDPSVQFSGAAGPEIERLQDALLSAFGEVERAGGPAVPNRATINKWLGDASLRFHDHPQKNLKSSADVIGWFAKGLMHGRSEYARFHGTLVFYLNTRL